MGGRGLGGRGGGDEGLERDEVFRNIIIQDGQRATREERGGQQRGSSKQTPGHVGLGGGRWPSSPPPTTSKPQVSPKRMWQRAVGGLSLASSVGTGAFGSHGLMKLPHTTEDDKKKWDAGEQGRQGRGGAERKSERQNSSRGRDRSLNRRAGAGEDQNQRGTSSNQASDQHLPRHPTTARVQCRKGAIPPRRKGCLPGIWWLLMISTNPTHFQPSATTSSAL